MQWLQNLIIFFGGILIYLHIYIHFKISTYNEFTEIQSLSKDKILSAIYYKLPFVFDGTTIIKSLDLDLIKGTEMNEKKHKEDKDTEVNEINEMNEIKEVKEVKDIKVIKEKNKYIIKYEKLPMLEPSVRFFTKNTVYELKKNKKIDVERNLECRNFYMVHSGKVTIYCIHPKYKNKLNDFKPFLKENEKNILRVELHPNSILFVPNYWYVYVKAHEKSIIEKVQYKTILNEFNFIYEKYNGSA